MMEKVARDMIVELGNKQGGFLVIEDSEFNAKFYKFIVDHYLRKFHTHFKLSHLITFLLKYSRPFGIPGPGRWRIRQ